MIRNAVSVIYIGKTDIERLAEMWDFTDGLVGSPSLSSSSVALLQI
jgi:hypothetical protein